MLRLTLDPIVEVEQLTKGWNASFRLGPLDFTVAPAEILSVVGPKGAGKTMLMQLLWGRLRADKGNLRILGRSMPEDFVAVRKACGYVPDNPPLYLFMRPRHFLLFSSMFYGANQAYASELLQHFGINRDVTVHELKTAERLKLALTAAVQHQPRLLLLDQPLRALEDNERRQVLDFVKDLADSGTAIVVTAEVSEELQGIAHASLKLKAGKTADFRRNATGR